MMRGLAVAGPRPSQGVAAQIKNAHIEDVSRLGVELLARLASGMGQRRLTHRNPDLRVTSIDQRGTPIPAVRRTEIERQGSTQSGRPMDSVSASYSRCEWMPCLPASNVDLPGFFFREIIAPQSLKSTRLALPRTRSN